MGGLRPMLVLFFALAGCSVVITDFEPVKCTSDEMCADHNVIEGLPATCRAFYCSDGACLRYGRDVEMCDGLDNDCDGLIDEPGPGDDGELSQTLEQGIEARSLVSSLGRPSGIAYGLGRDGEVTAVWSLPDTSSREAGYAVIGYQPELIVSEGVLRHLTGCQGEEECGGRVFESTDLFEGCFHATGTGSDPMRRLCSFAEVAVDGSSDPGFVVSINTDGCSEGQLRVGSLESNGEDFLASVLLGPHRRSNSYLGIDPGFDSEGRLAETCGDGEEPVCGESTTGCGATQPAIAGLRGADDPQALVAWLGAERGRSECGGEEAAVLLAAVHLQTGTRTGDPYHWVTASNEARPQALGRTRGGGAPAIISYRGVGYFVGFGDTTGGLGLHFVPPADTPKSFEEEECTDIDTCPWTRNGLETGPITGLIDFDLLDSVSDGPVDHVALSLGHYDGGEAILGIAWLEGCGTEEVAVGFRRVSIELERSAPTGVIDSEPAVRLSLPANGGEEPGPPQVVFVPDGFVLEGYSRDGSEPVETGRGGGWIVAWSSRSSAQAARIVARRVLELDGLPLHDAELIELSSGPGRQDVEATDPFLFVRGDGIEILFREKRSEELMGSWFGCGASE